MVRLSDLPGEDQYPDEDAFYDARAELFGERGGEGFVALLRELAPHLESPLLILAVEATPLDEVGYAARVWRVELGAEGVETLGV